MDLNELSLLRQHLINLKDCSMINNVDATIQELNKKEFKIKEQKVLEIHPYSITEIEIKKRNKIIKMWQTKCGDSRPRCSSYEAIIDKLYSYYNESVVINDYSFHNIFLLALNEKIRTERPKEKTIRDYHNCYKAFITDEFGKKDIRHIKASQVKEYIQDISANKMLSKKRFYKFKGILNLAFNYALDPERKIIEINPVPTKNSVYVKNLLPISHNPKDKAFQPDEIERIKKWLWERVDKLHYDVNGFAILFSIETGVRVGEIPSLKWSDITDKSIHIHSQQNDEYVNDKKTYYYNPTTKNEKGINQGGRHIPKTIAIERILDALKNKQNQLGIKSEWVFCRKDNSWITTTQYYESLFRVSKKLGLRLTNNHAFRMALNSYVYVPMGLPATERAKLLGHSVETNLKYYTFARTDDYIDELKAKIDAFQVGTFGYPKIVPFIKKSESQDYSNIKAFAK